MITMPAVQAGRAAGRPAHYAYTQTTTKQVTTRQGTVWMHGPQGRHGHVTRSGQRGVQVRNARQERRLRGLMSGGIQRREIEGHALPG